MDLIFLQNCHYLPRWEDQLRPLTDLLFASGILTNEVTCYDATAGIINITPIVVAWDRACGRS